MMLMVVTAATILIAAAPWGTGILLRATESRLDAILSGQWEQPASHSLHLDEPIVIMGDQHKVAAAWWRQWLKVG